MVDAVLIMRKLGELEEHLDHVKEYANISLDDYTKDWRAQRIVERTLQIMIELCIDIAGHIVSDRRLRVPTGYADVFVVLREAGLIDEELGRTMEKMAKFRNIVVHNYDRVDAAVVILILRRHLDDFLHFKDKVLKILIQ